MGKEVEIICTIDREADTVSILLSDIPVENLDTVLEDISMKTWRTNVADGIRAQYFGKSLGITASSRKFNVREDNE